MTVPVAVQAMRRFGASEVLEKPISFTLFERSVALGSARASRIDGRA
jgi:FixJ family two-component response regulator